MKQLLINQCIWQREMLDTHRAGNLTLSNWWSWAKKPAPEVIFSKPDVPCSRPSPQALTTPQNSLKTTDNNPNKTKLIDAITSKRKTIFGAFPWWKGSHCFMKSLTRTSVVSLQCVTLFNKVGAQTWIWSNRWRKAVEKNLAPFSLTGITKARPLSPDLWSVTVLYPTFIFKYLLSQYKPDRKTPLSLT